MIEILGLTVPQFCKKYKVPSSTAYQVHKKGGNLAILKLLRKRVLMGSRYDAARLEQSDKKFKTLTIAVSIVFLISLVVILILK